MCLFHKISNLLLDIIYKNFFSVVKIPSFVLSLGNAALWVIYDAIVGTTAVFSQIFSFIAITAALIRYRKRR